MILAAISWAANIIYLRMHRWIASPFQLLVWQALVATMVLVPIALIVEGWPESPWSPRLVLLFLYSGIVASTLAYWAMSMVNRSLPASTTALGTTATPLVGIAAAAIILGEPVDLSLAVAATLIIGGIVLNTTAGAARS